MKWCEVYFGCSVLVALFLVVWKIDWKAIALDYVVWKMQRRRHEKN